MLASALKTAKVTGTVGYFRPNMYMAVRIPGRNKKRIPNLQNRENPPESKNQSQAKQHTLQVGFCL